VFHGGAILPGVKMMLDSLHEKTASLPQVQYKKLDPELNDPAKQTDDAMVLGVSAAACGAVRMLTERYAEYFEGYPKVIATGGDMGILENDELIEAFVPDLQLVGLRVACEKALGDNEDE
jgi:type III pantothenate kinase